MKPNSLFIAFLLIITIFISSCSENNIVEQEVLTPSASTSSIVCQGNLNNESSLTRSEKVEILGNIKSSDTEDIVLCNPVYNEYGEEFRFEHTYHPTGVTNEYELSWKVIDSNGVLVEDNSLSLLILHFIDDGSSNFVMDVTTLALFDPTDASFGAEVNTTGGNPSSGIKFAFDATALTNNNTIKTISSLADGDREPNIVSGSVTIYDSLSKAHQITLTFTKFSSNSWKYIASVPGTSTASGLATIATGTIWFNSDGSLTITAPSEPTLTFSPAAGADPVSVDLNFGSDYNGIVQTSALSTISSFTF